MTDATRDVFQIELTRREVIQKEGFAAQLSTDLPAAGATLGYPTLATGGAVAQLTDKSTGVTLSKETGQITTHAAELAAGAIVLFTLTNTEIGANDVVAINRKSGGTAGAYKVWTDSVAAGSAVIGIQNDTAGPLSEALVLQFAVFAGKIA